MTDLLVVNQSTLVTDSDVRTWLTDIQTQVHRDLAPIWNVDSVLDFGVALPSAAVWRVILKDLPDDPNDLGFHLLDNGIPEARIFVKPTLDDGDAVSGVLSHEIVEMLCDPSANRMTADNRYIIEVADPVQQSGYMIGQTYVSNFVHPAYFGWPGRAFDHNGQLTAPCPVLAPGGYQTEWTGTQWQSRFGREANGRIADVALSRAAKNGRTSWRAARGAP